MEASFKPIRDVLRRARLHGEHALIVGVLRALREGQGGGSKRGDHVTGVLAVRNMAGKQRRGGAGELSLQMDDGSLCTLLSRYGAGKVEADFWDSYDEFDDWMTQSGGTSLPSFHTQGNGPNKELTSQQAKEQRLARWRAWVAKSIADMGGQAAYREKHARRAEGLDAKTWWNWELSDSDASFVQNCAAVTAWSEDHGGVLPRQAPRGRKRAQDPTADEREEARLGAFRNLSGIVRRAGGREAYCKQYPHRAAALNSASWWEWDRDTDATFLATGFNFASTADIIGGNSGSPVVNAAGELVGVIFDGNIDSLVLDVAYDDRRARAVAVDAAGVVAALEKVYAADTLLEELLTDGAGPR